MRMFEPRFNRKYCFALKVYVDGILSEAQQFNVSANELGYLFFSNHLGLSYIHQAGVRCSNRG